MTVDEVINFWFVEIDAAKWWIKDESFDRHIVERFGETQRRASDCELSDWRSDARGRLAEIIVLDQFSRNMYRGQALAFAQDPLALALAQTAIDAGVDRLLNPAERSFLYMPFMHSESLLIHSVGIKLFETLAIEGNLDSARRHRAIIEKFGRYPHRNDVLGRDSTPEEVEFLKQPGSSF